MHIGKDILSMREAARVHSVHSLDVIAQLRRLTKLYKWCMVVLTWMHKRKGHALHARGCVGQVVDDACDFKLIALQVMTSCHPKETYNEEQMPGQ